MEVKEIHINKPKTVSSEKSDELTKKLRKEHDRPVKGMFEFLDAQGGWLDFCYRFFKDENIKTYRLVHGEICELPMGLVKHLNNTKKKIRKFGLGTAERGGELPVRGLPSTYEVTSRVRFTPVDVL
jgi:hypothetical protein